MNSAINIHNYEAFFLLYVDNELSAADRQSVEQFVQSNPGLAIELDMLQQLQLPGEQLVFGKKEGLYRNETSEINLSNHEEQFLLYVDDELSARAKTKVETFVLQHPALQETFTQLKQTRLDPEVMIFADKPSLYRKEEKERRVFYMNWQRLAVAAALIGLIVLVWTVLPGDQKSAQQNIAGVQSNKPAVIAQGNNNTTASINTDNNTKNTGSETVTAATVSAKNNIAPLAAGNNSSIEKDQLMNAVANNTIVTASIEPAKTETAKADVVPLQTRNGFSTAITTTQSVSGDHNAAENAEPVKMSITPDVVVASGPNNIEIITQPAVYKELDTEDEKKSLLLGSLEINKDKLRGFFRKAGSIFRSKSKTEDEKTESRPPSGTRSLK